MRKFAQDIVDKVHSLWKKKKEIYSDGYAVFYSAVKKHPDLFLLGVNPGGDKESFSGKEKLVHENIPMEYFSNRHEHSYPMAKKTATLFDAAGHIDILKKSVKSNLNFFRSRDYDSLPKEDADFCSNIILKLIREVEPKILFCEALGVFDQIYSTLYKGEKLRSLQEYKRKNNRKYVSFLSDDLKLPKILIGIPHLTGKKQPSAQDFEIMSLMLKQDIKICL